MWTHQKRTAVFVSLLHYDHCIRIIQHYYDIVSNWFNTCIDIVCRKLQFKDNYSSYYSYAPDKLYNRLANLLFLATLTQHFQQTLVYVIYLKWLSKFKQTHQENPKKKKEKHYEIHMNQSSFIVMFPRTTRQYDKHEVIIVRYGIQKDKLFTTY